MSLRTAFMTAHDVCVNPLRKNASWALSAASLLMMGSFWGPTAVHDLNLADTTPTLEDVSAAGTANDAQLTRKLNQMMDTLESRRTAGERMTTALAQAETLDALPDIGVAVPNKTEAQRKALSQKAGVNYLEYENEWRSVWKHIRFNPLLSEKAAYSLATRFQEADFQAYKKPPEKSPDTDKISASPNDDEYGYGLGSRRMHLKEYFAWRNECGGVESCIYDKETASEKDEESIARARGAMGGGAVFAFGALLGIGAMRTPYRSKIKSNN